MASAYRSPAHADQVRAWCRGALARWTVEHESSVVNTSLGRTQVVSAGAGDRICLYLSGTNFNASTSEAVLSALASRCRVYAADLPGQPGLSAATRPDDEVRGYAAWVAEVIAWVRDRHDVGALVLAGHSRGAAVALSAEPDSVHGLVLLSPAGLSSVRPTPRMLWATVPWLLRRNDAGSRRLLDYMSGPDHAPTPELVDWMTVVAGACRTTGAPGPLPDADVLTWRDRTVRVAVGEHDAFFPVGPLRERCRTTLGVEPSVVAGAGHLLVEEEPELVADLVADVF